jgi:Ribonuclease G/E
LQEFFTEACISCGGLGWIFSPETVTARIDRDLRRAHDKPSVITVTVHPAVAEYLKDDSNPSGNTMMFMLEREHRCKLDIIVDEEYDQDEFGFKEIAGGNVREEG